jgi:predicted Zn finger-like uncharacterized protein
MLLILNYRAPEPLLFRFPTVVLDEGLPMPTVLDCPSCGRKFRVPDALAGRKVKCPQCGEPIRTVSRNTPRSAITANGGEILGSAS